MLFDVDLAAAVEDMEAVVEPAVADLFFAWLVTSNEVLLSYDGQLLKLLLVLAFLVFDQFPIAIDVGLSD
jgi:hypothetical protein